MGKQGFTLVLQIPFSNKQAFPAKLLSQGRLPFGTIASARQRSLSCGALFEAPSLIFPPVPSPPDCDCPACTCTKPAAAQARWCLNHRQLNTLHGRAPTAPSERARHSSGEADLFLIVFYDTNRHSLHMDLKTRFALGCS